MRGSRFDNCTVAVASEEQTGDRFYARPVAHRNPASPVAEVPTGGAVASTGDGR